MDEVAVLDLVAAQSLKIDADQQGFFLKPGMLLHHIIQPFLDQGGLAHSLEAEDRGMGAGADGIEQFGQFLLAAFESVFRRGDGKFIGVPQLFRFGFQERRRVLAFLVLGVRVRVAFAFVVEWYQSKNSPRAFGRDRWRASAGS